MKKLAKRFFKKKIPHYLAMEITNYNSLMGQKLTVRVHYPSPGTDHRFFCVFSTETPFLGKKIRRLVLDSVLAKLKTKTTFLGWLSMTKAIGSDLKLCFNGLRIKNPPNSVNFFFKKFAKKRRISFESRVQGTPYEQLSCTRAQIRIGYHFTITI